MRTLTLVTTAAWGSRRAHADVAVLEPWATSVVPDAELVEGHPGVWEGTLKPEKVPNIVFVGSGLQAARQDRVRNSDRFDRPPDEDEPASRAVQLPGDLDELLADLPAGHRCRRVGPMRGVFVPEGRPTAVAAGALSGCAARYRRATAQPEAEIRTPAVLLACGARRSEPGTRQDEEPARAASRRRCPSFTGTERPGFHSAAGQVAPHEAAAADAGCGVHRSEAAQIVAAPGQPDVHRRGRRVSADCDRRVSVNRIRRVRRNRFLRIGSRRELVRGRPRAHTVLPSCVRGAARRRQDVARRFGEPAPGDRQSVGRGSSGIHLRQSRLPAW